MVQIDQPVEPTQMTSTAIGQIIPNIEAVKRIAEETQKRALPVVKADKDSFQRSRKKSWAKKIEAQKARVKSEGHNKDKAGKVQKHV